MLELILFIIKNKFLLYFFNLKKKTTMSTKSKLQILVKKIHPQSIIAKKKTSGSAGYDLHSVESKILHPQIVTMVDIGLSFKIPEGYYGRIADRSSMALKGITVGGGVIDSDYRGCVQVIFNNNSQNQFHINVGDRIAQLIFVKISEEDELTEVTQLDDTVRGSGGFGSTGK
jgi:dUTP pyrophosphatase